MTIALVSQIDIHHWTVTFLDGPWKDQIGDYKIVHPDLEAGQHLEVEVKPYKRRPQPTITGYCGLLEVKAVIAVKPTTKKVK